jgi:DTW domain-containing protein
MRNLKEYIKFKQDLKAQEFIPRENCSVCLLSKRTCFCHLVKSFDSKVIFAILIHKLEVERKIATGNMSHLILQNSYLLPGHDYTHDETVNQLIDNPKNHCVVLYPGEESINLSKVQTYTLCPDGKQLVVFVIDGTWATARQTMYMSTNLNRLPRISFDSRPSNFRIRKQPKVGYCSTVEAIHQTIELLGDSQGYSTESRKHDNLLEVFDYMVETQIREAQG